MNENEIHELEVLAAKARKLIIESLVSAGCGHPGGALSSVELLVSLFFKILKINPDIPMWDKRDHFILSKGHSSIGLYSVMALRGYFDIDTMKTFRQNESILGGHPDMQKVPGIEISTGSLGHGLSVGVGMALGTRLNHQENKIFVLLGDGETQEGSIWEAAMSAAHFKLDNLIAIVDRNQIQIDGNTEEVMGLEPYRKKWEAFGWTVREIDGHDMNGIIHFLSEVPFAPGTPSMVISNTVKGKGVSFMENTCTWHGGAPSGELSDVAVKEVCCALEIIK
jgi:transketolase